jgi:hypothetical protein
MSSLDEERKKWASKVGRVFTTTPRDGNSKSTVWLPRTKSENRFGEVLENPGVHICVDGPTGTGKTSLALTVLHKAEIKYTLVQITQSMDWAGFCKRLIHPLSNEEFAVSTEVELGVDKWLPHGKFRVSLGSKGRPSEDLNLLDSLAKSWSEHDICQLMATQNTALLIDDFERANDDIVRRVSDMCKLLTQSYQKPYAKIIVVGTSDICKRIYDANPSLESRLEEISLGTLPSQYDSWRFLLLGWDRLKLRHPGNDNLVTKEERYECVEAVYEAADGLPKGLNELGRDISMRGLARSRISPADVKEVAREMPKNLLRIYRSEFPVLVKCVEGNPVVRAVLQHLYSEGIGHIHNWSDIEAALQPNYSSDQIDNAVCELVNANFLVNTGIRGDILFVTKPSLAHTLGVLVSNPERYKVPKSMYGRDGQLVFPLLKKGDEQLSLPYSDQDTSE